MPKCPPSEMAVSSLRGLSDAYRSLIAAAAEQERSELPDKAQKLAAWRRAEHTGRLIDNILANWEQETCPAVFYSCAWEECERSLRVIDSLTPCNQWQMPIYPVKTTARAANPAGAANTAQSASQIGAASTAPPASPALPSGLENAADAAPPADTANKD